MHIYGKNQKGKNKEKNDDRIQLGTILLNEEERDIDLDAPFSIAIADGVGGNPGGDLASEFVCKEISKKELSDFLSDPDNISKYNIELEIGDRSQIKKQDLLKYYLEKINKDLLDYSKGKKSFDKMATTLTGIFIDESYSLLFHCGNTRAYSFNGKYLRQLTEDQTTITWLKKMGRYDEVSNVNKNEIYSCFGSGNEKFLKIDVKKIENYSNLLFTSDGIHDHISIDQMEKIMAYEKMDIGSKFDTIMKIALSNGSKDDMSIIYLKR